jgi:hypothetical protein
MTPITDIKKLKDAIPKMQNMINIKVGRLFDKFINDHPLYREITRNITTSTEKSEISRSCF